MIALVRPRAFNDPFELRPHISKTEDPLAANVLQWRKTSNFVILSLAENRESLLMWAHYTDSHRGFLIGFDNSDGILETPSPHRHFGPVWYCHHRPSHSRWKEVTNEELFYAKSSEWVYEREWRIVDSVVSADGDPFGNSGDCWPFRFRPQALREVILGHRAAAIQPDVTTILREPRYEHVNLLIAEPDRERYQLNFSVIPRSGWGPQMFPAEIEDDETHQV